jgi:Fur family transcriptional regulator, ferric uptake regulator
MQMEIICNNKKQIQSHESNHSPLKQSGQRVTSQRALILKIIQEKGSHLDADEIYRQAKAFQPRISLSTVYRTLKVLKRPGLIEELHLDDSHHHYEIKSSLKHHHLVCLGCGKVVEFQYPLDLRIKRHIPEARDFEIVGAEVRLTGYCASCQKKKEFTENNSE